VNGTLQKRHRVRKYYLDAVYVRGVGEGGFNSRAIVESRGSMNCCVWVCTFWPGAETHLLTEIKTRATRGCLSNVDNPICLGEEPRERARERE
jgi:hypothetical protein